MTKDEAVKTISSYKKKVEQIEKKIRYIQAQQEYRDEISFGFYLQNIDFLILTIGLNLEALEVSIDRTLSLYQEGFVCQTERYVEDDTKTELKKVRKCLRDIDTMIERAVTERSVFSMDWEEIAEKELKDSEEDVKEKIENGWL